MSSTVTISLKLGHVLVTLDFCFLWQRSWKSDCALCLPAPGLAHGRCLINACAASLVENTPFSRVQAAQTGMHLFSFLVAPCSMWHLSSLTTQSLYVHAQSCPNSFVTCGLWPARLLCPWDSPGKNTGVGCHALLQGIFQTQGSNPHLLCLLP